MSDRFLMGGAPKPIIVELFKPSFCSILWAFLLISVYGRDLP